MARFLGDRGVPIIEGQLYYCLADSETSEPPAKLLRTTTVKKAMSVMRKKISSLENDIGHEIDKFYPLADAEVCFPS